MRKRQLVYIIMIISLITTNISFGQGVIIKGNENISKLVKEIDSLLKIKYSNPNEYGEKDSNTNNVYKIIADGDIVETASDLKLKIERYILDQQVLDIEIIDKGHKIENENILGKEYSKYDRYQSNEELYEIYTKYKDKEVIKDIQILDKYGVKTNDISKIEKVLITLIGSHEVEIKNGTDKLDFTKYIDKNGNRIDLTNVDINTPEGLSVAKRVVGFEKAKELSYSKEFDIPSKVVANIKVVEEALVEEKDLSQLYNGSYSKLGKEFITLLADKVFYHNGNKFNVNYDLLSEGSDEQNCKNNITNIIYKNEKYSFDIKMNIAKNTSLYLSGNQNFKLTLYSDDQYRLNKFRNDVIDAIVNGNKNLDNREYDILAGDDRFETSVEVSKEYIKANGANGIVLVGENAVVDGLSAAPFAKYKNSPILLTKKDSIPNVVMNEIKRIFNSFSNTDTIYIIGGEDVISDKVYNQLVSELKKVRIVRISGEDRYETSMNICNNMDLSKVNKAYVVGGDGEVDAMSIAPLASREGVPIIVSPKDKISKDIERFIEFNEKIVSIDVIGGRNVVDTQVMLDIKNSAKNRKNNKDINIKRVWGEDRQETNANVLKMFEKNNEDKIIVAKDGMSKFSHLVDAMAAASLGYPIVLGSDKVADEQVSSVSNIVSDKSKLIQVGYGIDDNVIKILVDNMNR